MPKEEWGVKRVCPTTGKRFYDLGRTPVVSPYTGEVVSIDEGPRRGAGSIASSLAVERTKPRAAAAVRDDDDEAEIIVDDDSEDVDLEEDLLEDDDEDKVSLDDLTDVASENDDD